MAATVCRVNARRWPSPAWNPRTRATASAIVGSTLVDFACPSRWLVVVLSPEGLAAEVEVLQDKKLLLRPRAPRVAMGARPQPQIGQSIDDATAPRAADGTSDARSVDELLKYINGDSTKSTPKKKQANPKRRQQRS